MNYKESLKVPSLRSLSFEALSNFFEHFRPNNDLYVGHLWWRIARSFQTIIGKVNIFKQNCAQNLDTKWKNVLFLDSKDFLTQAIIFFLPLLVCSLLNSAAES